VAQTVNSNLEGVVPDDLADFILDVKVYIASALNSLIASGAIGPFRDSNGATRDINLNTDIQVEQATDDPTKYYFNYTYNGKYPALRFFGQFTVDSPFTGTGI
jgi:hypothetical protein